MPGVVQLVETVTALRDNRTRGGSWMARQAVEALLEVATGPASSSDELLERLVVAGRELVGARPAMGAIAHAVGRLVGAASTASHLELEQLRRVVLQEGAALIASRDRAAASIAVQLAPSLEGARVLTHSASATVREAVLHTPPADLSCTVSAPFEEGRRLAEELRAEGLAAELVEDDEVLRVLEGVSLVLVGADTVYEDGSVKNKIGTRPLAEAAQSLAVPVVVACEVLKFAPIPAPTTADEPDLRDVTPAGLVERIVTEEGALPPDEARLLIDRTPFLRDGYRLVR
jgi:ribose 1,5-bisphosphate isomerase